MRGGARTDMADGDRVIYMGVNLVEWGSPTTKGYGPRCRTDRRSILSAGFGSEKGQVVVSGHAKGCQGWYKGRWSEGGCDGRDLTRCAASVVHRSWEGEREARKVGDWTCRLAIMEESKTSVELRNDGVRKGTQGSAVPREVREGPLAVDRSPLQIPSYTERSPALAIIDAVPS